VTGTEKLVRLAITSLIIIALVPGLSHAVDPAASILPSSTKSYVSIPDYDQAAANFDKTQIGHMLADPLMQPFTDDLKSQIKSKLIAGGVKLGITLDDLKDVWSGEICFATAQPDGPKSDAVVLLVDVTDNKPQAEALLKKISANQIKNGAKKSNVTIAGDAVTQFTLPLKPGQAAPQTALYVIAGDWLIAADSAATVEEILRAIQKRPTDSLANLPSFQAVMKRAAEGNPTESYDFQWFVEPFGYIEVMRSQAGGRKKRGTDLLGLLRNQGFDAVQAVGGQVRFAGEEMEFVHHTFIHAPQDVEAAEGDRFRLGARVLSFPNDSNFAPYAWVPADIATFLDFRWDVRQAFFHSESIVNEYANDEIFDALIDSLETDPTGPQVDVVSEIIDHLDNKVCMMVDVKKPIDPQSEQRLVAFKLLRREPVKAAIDRIMEQDPNTELHEVNGEKIWEIKEEEEEEIPTLTIVAPGFPEPLA